MYVVNQHRYDALAKFDDVTEVVRRGNKYTRMQLPGMGTVDRLWRTGGEELQLAAQSTLICLVEVLHATFSRPIWGHT